MHAAEVFLIALAIIFKAIISSAAFTALLLMAVASTMLTIAMTTPRLRRLRAESGRALPDQGVQS